MRFQPSEMESRATENKNHDNYKFGNPHWMNNPTIDLSSSNPHSQYSISHHGLTSDHTLTNLLMYESEYVPMMKKDAISRVGEGQPIDETSQEEEPTYYHDNTQDQKYEPSDEQSEDQLYNFILKLEGVLAYRTRIQLTTAFEKIYQQYVKKNREEKEMELSVSDSDDEQDKFAKKESIMTFRNPNGSDIQNANQFNMFNFNSRIKRKSASSIMVATTGTRHRVNVGWRSKAIKNVVKVDGGDFKSRKIKEESFKPSKPIIRLLPDCIKEENIDEFGFSDFFDPPSVEHSSSSNQEPDVDIMDYINIGKELKNEYPQPPPPPQIPIKNSMNQIQTSRPASLYLKAENPRNFRPISNIQSPIHRKPQPNAYVISQEAVHEYGNPQITYMEQVSKPSSIRVNPQRFQPQSPRTHHIEGPQRVRITFRNGQENESCRSHSEFARYGHPPSIHSPNQPLIRTAISPQHNPNKINVVRSQYYNIEEKHQQPMSVPIEQAPKRNHSAPSSPLINKFVSRHEPDSHFRKKEVEMPGSIRQSFDEKLVQSHQVKPPEPKLSHRSYLTGSTSPYNQQPQPQPQSQPSNQKPMVQSCQQGKNTEYSDYYQFTRPTNKPKNEINTMNNSNSISSLKSGKSKKINIVSCRKPQFAGSKN